MRTKRDSKSGIKLLSGIQAIGHQTIRYLTRNILEKIMPKRIKSGLIRQLENESQGNKKVEAG